MGINMSYCMFENTATAMEEILEKMWEEDFDPDELSSHERRAYDKLHDMASSMKSAIEEVEERKYEEEISQRLEEEEDEE